MNFYKIVEGIMETLLIMYGVPFELVLIATFFLRIIMNLHLNKIVYKEYPWLKLVKDTRGMKIQGMQHVFLYKIVSVVYENVDVLLISAFVNPISVIIYSNYKYITKYVNDMIYMVGSSITSSLGNMLYSEEKENSFYTYEMINTMFYFIACFLTISLGYCINSFIVIWVGEDKVFDMVSFGCTMFLFYHYIVRRPQYILKDIFALYKELQMISIVESILNVILSLLLVKSYGIRGVLVATVISTLLTNFWYFPFCLYKRVFDKKPWLDMIKYVSVSLCVICGLVISYNFLPPISSNGYVSWFVNSCVYSLVLLLILGVVFALAFKSFRRLLSQCKEMLRAL